jgi:hypothetical protein
MAESTKAQTDETTDDAADESADVRTDETAAGIGAGPEGGPVPGDPSTEPVSTAAQAWGPGRVGPPSIAQDSDAPWHTPEGVAQLDPGAILPADTPIEGGKIALAQPDPAFFGAGPYGGDTPAPDAPNAIGATKPGKDKPGPDELPQGAASASDESDTGGPVTVPAKSSKTSAAASAEPSESADAAPSDKRSTRKS